MNKILLIVSFFTTIHSYALDNHCPPSMLEVCDYSYGTFYHLDNQIGINALGTYNQASFSNSTLSSLKNNVYAMGAGVEGYWDILTSNGLWISNKIDYINYLSIQSFASDQANYNLKLGYSFQPAYDYWQITPYITGMAGAGQLNWTGQINYGVGAGLKTQIALTTRNSIYADYNLLYLIDSGNFSKSYNLQFSTKGASLSSTPYAQNFEIGYKHAFNCSFNMQIFYRYAADNINFSFSGQNLTQSYSNTMSMFGLGFAWYIGI